MKTKHSVFRSPCIVEDFLSAPLVGEINSRWDPVARTGKRRDYKDFFAICWIPHDSNERINRSCILSGFNTTTDRVRDFGVESAWSILTGELPY